MDDRAALEQLAAAKTGCHPCACPLSCAHPVHQKPIQLHHKSGYSGSPTTLLFPVLPGRENLGCNSPVIDPSVCLPHKHWYAGFPKFYPPILFSKQSASKQNTTTLLLPSISCASPTRRHFHPRGSLTLQHVTACSTGHSWKWSTAVSCIW